jgi:integrase
MLYKRSKKAGSHWWVRFTIRGREVRVTSGTTSKTAAEEFERSLRDQLWREIQLGDIQHTWEDAIERWLKEKAHKRSIDRDQQAFDALGHHLRGYAVSDIQAEVLSACQRDLASSRAPGTVNRIMAVARGVLNACARWGWLTSVPKIEAHHVEKHDPRWITQEQFEALAGTLPPHLARMARFAVSTGLRWANVSGLRWSMVDLERGVAAIPSGETKARKAIAVPLSEPAKQLLLELWQLRSNELPAANDVPASAREYVFTDHLKRAPIGSPKTAWRKACERAGLKGFKFHDLRHTWAAWHTMNGTPPIILKTLGGWSSLAMVERYSALNPGHLSEWADNISRTRNGTQDVKNSENSREK